MPKRYVTLPTDEGDLKLRVTFNVAAEFEEATGVRIYGGDQEWLRTPARLRQFIYMAARAQHDDLTEEDVGERLTGQDFQVIARAVAEAVMGDAAKDKARSGAKGK